MKTQLQFRFDFYENCVFCKARQYLLKNKKMKAYDIKSEFLNFINVTEINNFTGDLVSKYYKTAKISINFLQVYPNADQQLFQEFLSPSILQAIFSKARFVTQLQIINFSVRNYQQQNCLVFLKKIYFTNIHSPLFVMDFLHQSTFKYLSWLQITKTNIKNKGLQILAKGRWNNLIYISLRTCGFSADGLKYLAKHNFSGLRTIALKQKLGNDGQRRSLKLRCDILMLDRGYADHPRRKLLFVNEIGKVDNLKIPRKISKITALYESKVLLPLL